MIPSTYRIVTSNQSTSELAHTPSTYEEPDLPPLPPAPPHPPFRAAPLTTGSQSRDTSLTRGRTQYNTGYGLPALSTAITTTTTSSSSRTPSTHPNIPESDTDGAPASLETNLQRKTSNKHHRQTSMINGVQHSRNTSLTSPSTLSPLSPDSLHNVSSILRSATSTRRLLAQTQTQTAAFPSGGATQITTGHLHGPSIDSAIQSSVNGNDMPDLLRGRITPSRTRRGHTPMLSASPTTTTTTTPSSSQPRTYGDFALQQLFHAFTLEADQKIVSCLSRADASNSPVEETCGHGVDSAFDQLLCALAHLTRHSPKPLVDNLMRWRQRKADAVSEMRNRPDPRSPNNNNINTVSLLPLARRATEPIGQLQNLTSDPLRTGTASDEHARTEAYDMLEKQAVVAIYILCRGLLEVFRQSTLAHITPELAFKLEDIVFIQLKAYDPKQTYLSNLRSANLKIYGRLLGRMSALDFARVTARFLQQLKSWQQEIAACTDTNAIREVEARIELMLLSMPSLCLPTDANLLYRACDFLDAFAQLFLDAHGLRIKQAYCCVFESLFSQIVPYANQVQDHDSFLRMRSALAERIDSMVSKPRHWSSALPVHTALLCLASQDSFLPRWIPECVGLISKVRDRTSRTCVMRSISKLTWTYLNRTIDPLQIRTQKVEEIIRTVLSPSKRTFISIEPSNAEAFLTFVKVVASSLPDLCFRSIVLPLLQHDTITATRDLRMEKVDPEKLILGIRSFLILNDGDRDGLGKEKPHFPTWLTTLPRDVTLLSPLNASTAVSPTDNQAECDIRTLYPYRDSPVDESQLDEGGRDFYQQFCRILTKIATLCDQILGAAPGTLERSSTIIPKTPLAEAFVLGKKDEFVPSEQENLYIELLKTVVLALPSCHMEHLSSNSIINLLCTGSTHPYTSISSASARSLRAMAQKGSAQLMCTSFPRFVFEQDLRRKVDRNDEHNHLELSLELFIDLLQTWVREIRDKHKDPHELPVDTPNPSAMRALQATSILPLVDEIESYGLFFACSQSRTVRCRAIQILQLVVQLDLALDSIESVRIIQTLETNASRILDLGNDSLTVLERSRLQKDKQQKGTQNVILELCCSDSYYDAAIWFKAFPNIIRHVFEACPHIVALSRNRVCVRLASMHHRIEEIVASSRAQQDYKSNTQVQNNTIEAFLEQWKLYLYMACVTLNYSGAQTQSQLANSVHARKTSKNSAISAETFNSARALFSVVISLLGTSNGTIRATIVVALSSINPKLYHTLLESLQYVTHACLEEIKQRIPSHHRTPSSPSRTEMIDRIRVEVAHIYRLTASFLQADELLKDTWILSNILNHAKALRLFLSDHEVLADWRHTRLRFHYCGLVEEIHNNTSRIPGLSTAMSFQSRRSEFSLMEYWCGFVQDVMAYSPIEDVGEKIMFAKEKNNLRVAALSAMASLCAGPISIVQDSRVEQFNVPRIISWLDFMFRARERKIHEIGQKALRNLILNNPDVSTFTEYTIQSCYGGKGPVALEYCFHVMADVFIEKQAVSIDVVKALAVVIFLLGHEDRDIRIKSSKVLRILDIRREKHSNLQHFDIGISDQTRAVYTAAQFEYSRRLAQTNPELAHHIFSEFCLQFRGVPPDIRRSMVAAVLPWLQMLELHVLPSTGARTPLSNMLMVNMIEITIHSGRLLHNEVQALWQALVTGPYGGNVHFILDFVTELCLERREQNFADFAKQVVVHLSGTPAGAKVFEHFLLHLAPKYMANERKISVEPSDDMPTIPYVADLTTMLPMGNRQANLSLGQLSIIFLVDLLVPPVSPNQDDTLKLIHAAFVLWDHHTYSVEAQAREMLVHLMHVLLIATTTKDVTEANKQRVEELVEQIRNKDIITVWSYGDHTGKDDFNDQENRVPPGMRYLVSHVVELLGLLFPDFSSSWAKHALHWASTCPVRHLSCRSFQVYRCMSAKLTPGILADMLARLSNTVSDEQADYQTFSIEILTTLKISISNLGKNELSKHPQLFWTTAACLETVHEREYFESLGMLEELLDNLDLNSASVLQIILRAQPPGWEGSFMGIQPLVYRGLTSTECMARASLVLRKLAKVPDNELIGSQYRVLYGVLAHLPYCFQSIKSGNVSSETQEHMRSLSQAADGCGQNALARALNPSQAIDGYDSKRFLSDIMQGIRSYYFPQAQAECMIFLLDLLSNPTLWFRECVLSILHELAPYLDMNNPEIIKYGSDILTPLVCLLKTKLCDQALTIMDLLANLDSSSTERTHARKTSMPPRVPNDGHPTQSLFGTATLTGWSVPVSSMQSVQTRRNVHHVFDACTDVDGAYDSHAETPEVDFQRNEEHVGSYFPSNIHADDTESFDTNRDANMGDIVMSLDDLDDFFDEAESSTTPTGEIRGNNLNALAVLDENDSMSTYSHYLRNSILYGNQTAASTTDSSFDRSSVLTPESAFYSGTNPDVVSDINDFRPSSGISSQPAFDDGYEFEGPGPEFMNEALSPKRPPLTNSITDRAQARPVLHTRSITSPVNQYVTSHSIITVMPPLPTASSLGLHPQFSSNAGLEDMVAEAESIPFPPLIPSISQGTTRSVPGTVTTPTAAESASMASGAGNLMRRGMRRLTGGKSESAKEKARLRAPSSGAGATTAGAATTGQSPRVPRVPLEYLSNLPGSVTPTSAGLPVSPAKPL